MIWNKTSDHVYAIRVTLELMNDDSMSNIAKRGAKKWLDHLLNDFSFDDRYAIRNAWGAMLEGQIYEH